MRRGFVFTLDALLSIILVSLVVISVVSVENNVSSVYNTALRAQNFQDANGVMRVLKSIPLDQILPESTIRSWINNGTLDTKLVDPSMTPLDIALTYWALSNVNGYQDLNLTSKADTILSGVISKLIPGYGYELLINSTRIASSGNSSSATDISSSTILVSGYSRGKKPLGYLARAYLTYATHRYSRLIGIQRLVAAGVDEYGYDNVLHVQIPINLPNDAEDVDVRGGIYARSVNYNQISLKVQPSGETYNLKSGGSIDGMKLLPGKNVLDFTIDSGGADEVGFGSGSVLLVSYNTNSTNFYDPNTVYFYNVTSRTGFVQFVTLLPTGKVNGIEAYLRVSGIRTVRLYYYDQDHACDMGLSKGPVNGIVYFNSSEIESGLERCGVSYNDLRSRAFILVFAFDTKWNENQKEPDYDTTPRQRHLYGFGESWVRVDVDSDLKNLNYAIPLSIPLYPSNFSYSGSGEISPDLSVSYRLPPKAIPWYADYWVAIQYQPGASGSMKFTESNPVKGSTTIASTGLIYYLYRYGYSRYTKAIMVNGTLNTFKITSSVTNSYHYDFRKGKSWGTIYYFLQAYAPYGSKKDYLAQGYPGKRGYNLTYYAKTPDGNIVKKQITVGKPPYLNIDITNLNPDEYAVDDAIIRLFSMLSAKNSGRPGSSGNPLLVVLPPEVHIDFSGISGIPNLSKPVEITLRIWRSKP